MRCRALSCISELPPSSSAYNKRYNCPTGGMIPKNRVILEIMFTAIQYRVQIESVASSEDRQLHALTYHGTEELEITVT